VNLASRCVFVLDLRAQLCVYKARALYTHNLDACVCLPWPHFGHFLQEMALKCEIIPRAMIRSNEIGPDQ